MATTAKLVVQRGARQRREIVLRPDRTTLIGRRRTCHICIPAPDVSREHCALVFENGKLIVRDLGSSNGTWVNGRQVKEAELHNGDTLTIGPVLFVVQMAAAGPGDTARPGEQAALAADAAEAPLAFDLPSDSAEPPTGAVPVTSSEEEADFEIVEAEVVEEEGEAIGDDEVTQFFIDMDEQGKT